MKLTANPASFLLPPNNGIGRRGAQFLRIMKLTTFIILAVCLHTSANTVAQQTVTFSGKEVSLENVFYAIKKQTSYRFFFNTDMLQHASKVSLDVKNAPIDQVMALALKNQALTFTIKGRTIFIMKKQEIKTAPISPEVNAPPIDVRGRVVNENGDPVEAVSVNVKGTSIIVLTNANGEFLINGVNDNATLVFTSVNMEEHEVRIKGKGFIDVALQTKISSMQEVVINKGYYTEKQIFSTGNVAVIKAKDIEKQPVQNPLLALVGRVPGLQVIQSSGFANSGVTVRVQGRNSISSGLEPLYIIDGIPYRSQTFPTIDIISTVLGNSNSNPNTPGGAGNPLNFINVADIESIDILKDADATSIYGSRGANGVILITTKKGKAGKTKLDITVRDGWGKVGTKLKMLNTEEYLNMRMEAKKNDNASILANDYDINGTWDKNKYADWQKIILGRTSTYKDADLNISGGNEFTQFLFGGTFHSETTIFPGSNSDKKGSVQFNIHHGTMNKKIDLNFSGSFVTDDNNVPTTDLTSRAFSLSPNAPEIYNEDGSLNWASTTNSSGAQTSTWINPFAILLNKYNNKVKNLISNALINYRPLPNLTLKSNFGYNYFNSREFSPTYIESFRPELRSVLTRMANYGNGEMNEWIVEPQASYQLSIGKGKIEALGGASFQQLKIERSELQGSGYNSDLVMKDVKAATALKVISTLSSEYNYSAIFGRLNYNYQDKYILNVTGRRDGSSRYGATNMFENFWGAGAAWIFTNENGIKENIPFLSLGKIKLSYGTSGNDNIGDYGFLSLYSPVTAGVPYQGLSGLSPTKQSNTYLKWETTNKLNAGLELGMFHDRGILNVNYYYNRSSNLITGYSLSVITGFSSVTKNFDGVVKNEGFEIALHTVNLKTADFSWSTSFNLTIPIKNGQLVSFPNFSNSSISNTYVLGKTLNDLKVYHYLGVDPTTGVYLFQNKNGDATSSPTVDDRIGFRNTQPKLFGGMQTNFSFKNFELDLTIEAQKRSSLLFLSTSSQPPGYFSGVSNIGNQPITVLKRWQKPGDQTNIQRYSTILTTSNEIYNGLQLFQASDGLLSDGSFFRMTNLSLSYQLPNAWRKYLHLQKTRFFVQAQNLFTVSKNKVLNPATDNPISLPPLRLITIGGQLTL